jgi:hypothetical protein
LGQEFNVLALVKGAERYIFVYDDVSRRQLIDAFRDQAADPDLSLNWFDAMVLTKKAREQQQTPEPETAPPEATPRSRI